MGRYKYENSGIGKLISFFAPFGVALGLLLCADWYLKAGGGRQFFTSLPRYIQDLTIPVSILLLVVILYVCFRKFRLAGRQPGGELMLEDGKLRMKTCRENHTETIELDLKTLTFIENDEECVKVVAPQGEFSFAPHNFGSMEEYEKFRMELTCEKYKK